MKHSVSSATEAYLQKLEAEEKREDAYASSAYTHNPDTLDQLIEARDLRIIGLNFYPELDLMLIVLSSRKVMKRHLSSFEKLSTASLTDLQTYELSRYGVHWPVLDEDLSLKGFLQDEIANVDRGLAA